MHKKFVETDLPVQGLWAPEELVQGFLFALSFGF